MALRTAKQNAENNEVEVEFILSDCFEAISNMRFDAIISNPPYLTEEEMEQLQKEVTYEPKLALDGVKDGLMFYRKIALDGKAHLIKGGILAFEIGYRQAEAVSQLLIKNNYEEIEILKDYSGNHRVVIAKWNAGGLHESN
jgi:release factor glutamine methyltransferase